MSLKDKMSKLIPIGHRDYVKTDSTSKTVSFKEACKWADKIDCTIYPDGKGKYIVKQSYTFEDYSKEEKNRSSSRLEFVNRLSNNGELYKNQKSRNYGDYMNTSGYNPKSR